MSKKPGHIGEVPAGSPVGTQTKRLCDGKKTKSKGIHWDRPVCPACVNALVMMTSHERDVAARRAPVWTWTMSTANHTWTSGGGAA